MLHANIQAPTLKHKQTTLKNTSYLFDLIVILAFVNELTLKDQSKRLNLIIR